jgi:hypothetical protein
VRTLFVFSFLALPAFDARAAGSLADLLACRGIADTSVRLACFDRESAVLAAPAPAAADPAEKTQENGIKSLTQDFGLPPQAIVEERNTARQLPPELTQLDARIKQIAAAADGRVVFTLDNGQVWRQLSAEGDLLVQAGQAVRISRGVLGSYYLRAPSGRGCKVARLR